MNTSPTGHRQRLKEKYSRFGHNNLFDYEKIELLLTYAVPRQDVKPLAKELLSRFGGIAGILDASKEELLLVPGVGENIANLIILVRNLNADFHKEHLLHKSVFTCTADVIHFVRAKLAGLRKEAFLVIYLNTGNETIDADILTNGTVDQVVIHTRELLAEAIKRSARGIILVHNHPGGSAEPSANDRILTESIRKAGSAMRIDLLDHLVITHDAAYSIAMEQRIELGNEDFYHLQDEGRQAAEPQKQNYDKLPFHPRKIKKTMTELTRKAKKKGDSE